MSFSTVYIQNTLLLSYLVIFSQVQLQQEQAAMLIHLRGLYNISCSDSSAVALFAVIFSTAFQ